MVYEGNGDVDEPCPAGSARQRTGRPVRARRRGPEHRINAGDYITHGVWREQNGSQLADGWYTPVAVTREAGRRGSIIGVFQVVKVVQEIAVERAGRLRKGERGAPGVLVLLAARSRKSGLRWCRRHH